jgi:hypothetical protein
LFHFDHHQNLFALYNPPCISFLPICSHMCDADVGEVT